MSRMKSRTRPDDMKLITQLIAILIVIEIVVSDLSFINMFEGTQEILYIFKISMISRLCKKGSLENLEENLRKHDKGRSFIVFTE